MLLSDPGTSLPSAGGLCSFPNTSILCSTGVLQRAVGCGVGCTRALSLQTNPELPSGSTSPLFKHTAVQSEVRVEPPPSPLLSHRPFRNATNPRLSPIDSSCGTPAPQILLLFVSRRSVSLAEALLRQVELAGGSLGSFLAQRVFRHKISKLPYQRGFSQVLIVQVRCVENEVGSMSSCVFPSRRWVDHIWPPRPA